ncbi:MAG: M16 family metallopeptidase [Bacillota bacterium]
MSNGLAVYVLTQPHLHALRLDFFLRDGSRWETPSTSGLAHFTEHLLFTGNELMPSKREIALALADIGGAANGETSAEVTSYYLMTRPVHLSRAVELFGAMVCRPRFDPDEMKAEKRIILAEIGEELRKGSVEELLWPDHPLSYYISGRPDSVRHFTREQVDEHYRSFYVPDNATLVVTGPVDAGDVRPLVERSFSVLKGNFVARALAAADVPLAAQRARFSTVADMPSFALSFGFRLRRPDLRQQAVLSLLNTILGASDTSRLFLGVREERGLVYTVDSMLTLWADVGSLEVELNASRRRLRPALSAVLQEIERLAAEEVPPTELARAKEWQVANLEGLQDDPGSLARRIALEELFHDMPSLPEAIRLTQVVTAGEVRAAAAAVLNPDLGRLFVQGPALDAGERSEIRAILRRHSRGT